MEQSLHMLAQAKVTSADEILVHQIKMQLVVEKARQVSAPREEGTTEPAGVPAAFYLRALQSQIQAAKQDLSIEMKTNSRTF